MRNNICRQTTKSESVTSFAARYHESCNSLLSINDQVRAKVSCAVFLLPKYQISQKEVTFGVLVKLFQQNCNQFVDLSWVTKYWHLCYVWSCPGIRSLIIRNCQDWLFSICVCGQRNFVCRNIWWVLKAFWQAHCKLWLSLLFIYHTIVLFFLAYFCDSFWFTDFFFFLLLVFFSLFL